MALMALYYVPYPSGQSYVRRNFTPYMCSSCNVDAISTAESKTISCEYTRIGKIHTRHCWHQYLGSTCPSCLVPPSCCSFDLQCSPRVPQSKLLLLLFNGEFVFLHSSGEGKRDPQRPRECESIFDRRRAGKWKEDGRGWGGEDGDRQTDGVTGRDMICSLQLINRGREMRKSEMRWDGWTK